MTDPRRVLVVEDDQDMRLFLEEELREAGYDVRTASCGSEAMEHLAGTAPDVVVTDLVLPGMRGNELLGLVLARDPGIPVVIITAFGNIESAVESMRAGAFHYVAKPFRMEHLLLTLDEALRRRRLAEELVDLRRALVGSTLPIVADSPAMRRTMELILRAAHADAGVLLLGESGTGKELLARALHEEGPRRERPFLALNCSAIPEALLESELFGHRRGSFTDARQDRRGLFQEADGGTILLDEIGDMPPMLQGKILRVLQEREVHPIGASAPIPVDVRVVAATHRDLQALVSQGRFRQDLYYRLNVVMVRVPPLRERPEDILPLVAHFLEKHARRMPARAGGVFTVSPEALDRIRSYTWPGNVRELENAVERAMVLCRDRVIRSDDLPEAVRGRVINAPAPASRSLSDIEREHIIRTLHSVKGNKAAAARLLGLDRKTLYRKLQQYGLHAS